MPIKYRIIQFYFRHQKYLEHESESLKSNISSSSNLNKLNKDSFFSGMILEEFPLPFFLKGSSFVNGFYEGFKRPGMTLAGIALLGTGGFC